MFSVRFVCTNHYMSSPIAGLDVRYSEFRGSEVKQVPVIQVFGPTTSGQKTCLHVHGVFPYIYIPYKGSGSHARLMYQIASSLDKALNISFGNANSTTQHVYKVMLVSGRPFYGFHVKSHQYFKIYFYNPLVVKRAVELLQNGAILNEIYQPHEAHIPYILQFMIDYNLYGMSYIKIGHVMYRRNPEHTEALNDVPEEYILPERINRVSTCELEADCVAADILNRRALTEEMAVNPGLAAIWEDEKQRRREEARSSQITPQASEQHPDTATTASEKDYMERLFSKLATVELQDVSESDSSIKISAEEERVPYPAETPDDCDLMEASFLDLHVHGSADRSTALIESTVIKEMEKTMVVDEDVVLSLCASHNDCASPLDASVFLNSQDMQLVEILQDLENSVEDDSILGSQQIEFGNQSSGAAEEEEDNLQDLSQPFEQPCNTENILETKSCIPSSEDSEEVVWDNTFWDEVEGNISQLDGADDTPVKSCRRKRLGVRGKVKHRSLVENVKTISRNENKTKFDWLQEDALNKNCSLIENCNTKSNNEDDNTNTKNRLLQEAALNGRLPTVPYSSASMDVHLPEVIVIESDEDILHNKVMLKKNDSAILEEIPPDSDGLSAELFTDDFESFHIQENGDQETNFQAEPNSCFNQELNRGNSSMVDYTENDGANSFYIANDTSIPFKNVLIGDPSFTAQHCSSDGDDLIAGDSIANVSWTGSNISKSWVTSDKSLEVDIGSPLLVPYESSVMQEVSPEKVSTINNSKFVEQVSSNAVITKRGRRRGASLTNFSKSSQARKNVANSRLRRSARRSAKNVNVNLSVPNSPNTSDLNLFSQSCTACPSELSLIVHNTDMLSSCDILPSCSIGSPSDEVKRIETLLRQGNIEEIVELSCNVVDGAFHQQKHNNTTSSEGQEEEIIEIVTIAAKNNSQGHKNIVEIIIDDSNTCENDANKCRDLTKADDRKSKTPSSAESEEADVEYKICEEIMHDILDTVEILVLDIDKDNFIIFKDNFERCRNSLNTIEINPLNSTSEIQDNSHKEETVSSKDTAVDITEKNQTAINEAFDKLVPQFLAQGSKNDVGCAVQQILAQDIVTDEGKNSTAIGDAPNSQLQAQDKRQNMRGKNHNANKVHDEPNPQTPAQHFAPSKKDRINQINEESESLLLAQDMANNAGIRQTPIIEETASQLQAQLYSLQSSIISPRKLRSSSSGETYSRKLARKREKRKEKPNKLSLSCKKKTFVTELNSSVNATVDNRLIEDFIQAPIICLRRLDSDSEKTKNSKSKMEKLGTVGKPAVENKFYDNNRNLRDSTIRASIISARRNLLDTQNLKNCALDKKQENENSNIIQKLNSNTVNSNERINDQFMLNKKNTFPAAKVKRKSSSSRDGYKGKCNQKESSSPKNHSNISDDDKHFGTSMIDSFVSCKENIVAIDNIPASGKSTMSTNLPSQHNEVLKDSKSAVLKVEIKQKPFNSEQFGKRLKKELFGVPDPKINLEMYKTPKKITLSNEELSEVSCESLKRHVITSHKKHKTKTTELPANTSLKACNTRTSESMEQMLIRPCFVKLEGLKDSVIRKFCLNEVNQLSSKQQLGKKENNVNAYEKNVHDSKGKLNSRSDSNGILNSRTCSLQRNSLERKHLDKHSEPEYSTINVEKVHKKEVKEQKQLCNSSYIDIEDELSIPCSARHTKTKKRKLSENNNVLKANAVAYETKEFGTLKVAREIFASLKPVKVSITRIDKPVEKTSEMFPRGTNEINNTVKGSSSFHDKKIPGLDGTADTSSSDDSVENNIKRAKKDPCSSQTLSIIRMNKKKKKEQSSNANKDAKDSKRLSSLEIKGQKSGSSTSPRRTRQKTLNLSQSSRESAYNPLDIRIKKSPKKGIQSKCGNLGMPKCRSLNHDRSLGNSSEHEGSVSDISTSIHSVNTKNEQSRPTSLVADSHCKIAPLTNQHGDNSHSGHLNDTHNVDQRSLRGTTTTSLKFISPYATKGNIVHRAEDSQLSYSYNQTTSSISNISSNSDNNILSQSASTFQKESELEVCDIIKQCSSGVGIKGNTSCSNVILNPMCVNIYDSQTIGMKTDNALHERTARKKLHFPKPSQSPNKTFLVSETESSKNSSSANSIPIHRSSATEKLNVQEAAHSSYGNSNTFNDISQSSPKSASEDGSKLSNSEETIFKNALGDNTNKQKTYYYSSKNIKKIVQEQSEDDEDLGIVSFYEVGLKSPDNIEDTMILNSDSSTTDSESDISSSDISQKGMCEEIAKMQAFVGKTKIYAPKLKAPTKESILITLPELDIPEHIGQVPFVSNISDATKKKHVGNKTLQLCSNSVTELQDFTGSIQVGKGIEFWRNKLYHGFGPISQLHMSQKYADINLKATLASQRKTIIAPSIAPPSVKEVNLWLKAKEQLRQKRDAEKLESEGDKQKETKTLLIPQSPGQEYVSDTEDVLSVISFSPLTPREYLDSDRSTLLASHSTPQQLSGKLPSPLYTPISKNEQTLKNSGSLLKNVMLTTRNSSLKQCSEVAACMSPSLPAIIEEDEAHSSTSEVYDDHQPSSDVQRQNFNLDPKSLKLDSSITEKQKGASVLESSEEESVSKILQQSHYCKLLITPKHLKGSSSCQIEGSTPENSHGFRMSLGDLHAARAVSEHQYLTILTMELHVQTRGDLRPDPMIDPIRALFYFIANDVPEDFSVPKEYKGLIVVNDKGTSSYFLKQTGSCDNVSYVPDEKALLFELVNLVRKWDPDILAGYEVEMLSWGYLFQRSFTLQINLCTQVSRVPNTRSNNQNAYSNASQSLDYSHDIRLPGRIVLNVWRLMRHEVALQSYTFESVMYHILHQRIPLHSFKQLTLWWDHKTHLYRWICVNYYMLRVQGIFRILQQLDLIERTSELARLFGIQFYEVLSRGSQFRVESMMLRLAKPLNYVPVSPSVKQRAQMRAPEALPLIMEPHSGFYSDPMIVLDFQSLYPSIIIAYNYCFSTCLGRVELLGQNEPFKFGCTQLKVSPVHLLKLKNDLNFSPVGIAFVNEKVRKGILPRMLQEILDTRLMVKNSMKEHKDDKTLQRVLHARQLGLKLIANVTYGYTAANFSGRMPSVEVGDSVVSKARETLHRAIFLVENTPKWKAQVVYGDTDSLFVLVPGRTREQAFKIGAEIAKAVTMDNPKPVKLKLEKVYQPCILQTKKRYVGYMYESADQEKPVYEAKGIETVRRDGCPAVAKILEKSLKILFDSRDVSLVKKYACRQFNKLIQGHINIQDLIFAREYRGMKGYHPGVCIPALELTRRWLQADKRAEPRVSERVPYIIVAGPPGLPLIQLVRSPHELLQDPSLRINVTYYITRVIIPPLQRCVSLLGADVHSWYADMPRKGITNLPTVVPEGVKKSTISHYFATTNCAVCDQQTHSAVCPKCEDDPQFLILTLENKLQQWERAYFNITKVCQSCCRRNESIECSSLDCPVLFRRNRALRDLDQGPFVRSTDRVLLDRETTQGRFLNTVTCASVYVCICIYIHVNLSTPVNLLLTSAIQRQAEEDMMKLLGIIAASMLDSHKQNMIAQDQLQFVSKVVLPCMELFSTLLPACLELYSLYKNVQDMWGKIVDLQGAEQWRPEVSTATDEENGERAG